MSICFDFALSREYYLMKFLERAATPLRGPAYQSERCLKESLEQAGIPLRCPTYQEERYLKESLEPWNVTALFRSIIDKRISIRPMIKKIICNTLIIYNM